MAMKSLRTDDCIEKIIDEYSDMVYKLAFSQVKNRENAEDIYQEVFLRLVKSNVDFESPEHTKAWLIRVTINCSKSLWNSAWFRHTVPLEDDNQPFNAESEPTDEERDVYGAVMQLPKKYRTVIHLYYYEDLCIADISRILGQKESAVTVQLYRARGMLKKRLEAELNYEQL